MTDHDQRAAAEREIERLDRAIRAAHSSARRHILEIARRSAAEDAYMADARLMREGTHDDD